MKNIVLRIRYWYNGKIYKIATTNLNLKLPDDLDTEFSFSIPLSTVYLVDDDENPLEDITERVKTYAGPLREKLESLNKYDAVFLKNNNSNIIDQKNLLKKYNKNIKIFDTYYEITNLNKFNLDNEFLIFSGIGNPLSFKKILINNKFKVVKEIIFPDHYNYKKKEIENIILVAKKNNYKIITTEKDLMKINNFDLKEVNFIEISLRIKNEKELIDFLRHKFYE